MFTSGRAGWRDRPHAPKHKSAQTVGATSGREATTFGYRFYWLFVFFSTCPLNRLLIFRLQYSSLRCIGLSRTSQLLPSSFRRRPVGNRPLVGLSSQASGRQRVPRGSSSNDRPASASKSPHFLEAQGQGLPAERGHPALGSLRLARPRPVRFLPETTTVRGEATFQAAAAPPSWQPPLRSRPAAALTACVLSTCPGLRGPEVSGGCCQAGALMKGPASGSSLGRSEVSERGVSLWWVMTSAGSPSVSWLLPHFRTFFFFF